MKKLLFILLFAIIAITGISQPYYTTIRGSIDNRPPSGYNYDTLKVLLIQNKNGDGRSAFGLISGTDTAWWVIDSTGYANLYNTIIGASGACLNAYLDTIYGCSTVKINGAKVFYTGTGYALAVTGDSSRFYDDIIADSSIVSGYVVINQNQNEHVKITARGGSGVEIPINIDAGTVNNVEYGLKITGSLDAIYLTTGVGDITGNRGIVIEKKDTSITARNWSVLDSLKSNYIECDNIVGYIDSAGHSLHSDSALHALNADSALHALDADSALHALDADSALHALDADSALHALDADSALHALDADSALHALDADSALHALDADTALHANTASIANQVGSPGNCKKVYADSLIGCSPIVVDAILKTTDTAEISNALITARILGGRNATSSIIYQTTSGEGTTGADHIFLGDNNGGRELLRIFNDGHLSAQSYFNSDSAFYLDSLPMVRKNPNTSIFIGTSKYTLGDANTYVGYNSGWTSFTSGNTCIGYYAGHNNTGSTNLFSGYQTGYSNTGSNQIGLGYRALYNSHSNGSIGIGFEALYQNTTGGYNIAIGNRAGTIGDNESTVFLGGSTSYSGYSSQYSTILGCASGVLTKFDNCVAIGYQAGSRAAQDTVIGSIFLGYQAGYNMQRHNVLVINNSSDTNNILLAGKFDSKKIGINCKIGDIDSTNYINGGGHFKGGLKVEKNINVTDTVNASIVNADTIYAQTIHADTLKGNSPLVIDQDSVQINGYVNITGGFNYELTHAYAYFEDSAKTIDIIAQNVPVYISNATQTLFTNPEHDGITFAGDTLTIISNGDYMLQSSFTISGNNTDDYRVGIYKNSVKQFSQSITTTGTSNFISCNVDFYLSGLVAGDDISLRISNRSGTQDCIIRSGTIFIEKKHN